MITSHKDLAIYQLSMEIVVDVYTLTKGFPKEEVYGLTSQLKRACISVPSNIAEGAGRKGKAEFIRFLYIAFRNCCSTILVRAARTTNKENIRGEKDGGKTYKKPRKLTLSLI